MEFTIGDPGRAASEVPEGGLPARVGPADVEVSAAALPGMRIRAASSRGILHRARQTSRQDAFALGQAANEVTQLIAVVCDGVGQFGRSAEAAIAVSWRLAELGVEGESWPAAFLIVNEELAKLAEEARAEGPEGDASEMATTAVAVSVRRDEDGWAGEVAWVGDSTLWHLSPASGWTLISDDAHEEDDDDAEYHSSAVRPLPSPRGECTYREFRAPAGALFVMTDGVANPLQWSDDVQGTLAEWWARPPDPLVFAAQVGFARKTHVDDRTVIGIWPDSGETADDTENLT